MYLDKTAGKLNPRGQQPQSNLQVSTVRSFEGGLNVTDTDLNMSPKFAKVLDNIERQIDGSLAVRPGTKLLTQNFTTTENIVNCCYFNSVVVAVAADGYIGFCDGEGNVTDAAFPSDFWAAGFTEVNFTIFNNDLIICNGMDKPLIISGDNTSGYFMQVQFLIDLGSVSNVNTPVGKYVIAHSQYTCIAGVLTDTSTLYISSKGTSGTYVIDPAPNDGIALDLGPRVSLGSSAITGLVAYRDKLLVTFERGVLPVNLGVYTGSPAVHTPTDDGFIEEFGCLTHRSLISVGDDTFYTDNIGVNSISRVNVFNTLRPTRASHLIDPLITELIQPLTPAQISQYVFAVYDLRNFRYMLFVPTFDDGGNITETICFSYTNIPGLKIQAWARLRGWIWQCACRTALQNVVFARGSRLYTYDFDNDSIGADLLNDIDQYEGLGAPIDFTWELPWADFKHRMDIKVSRYVALDTQGDATFQLDAYVDNITSGNATYDPEMLSMQFIGGSAGGFGGVPYGDAPYGGGRRTVDERLIAWTTKFKLLKLKLSGSTRRKLKFISISIAYVHGGIRR
jgi:hypothetical protein